jgi:hypothetical protein
VKDCKRSRWDLTAADLGNLAQVDGEVLRLVDLGEVLRLVDLGEVLRLVDLGEVLRLVDLGEVSVSVLRPG